MEIQLNNLDDATVLTIDLQASREDSDVRDMFRKIDRVVPDDIRDRFDALFHYEDGLQWERGDLTNTIWQNVQGKKLRNKQGRPYTFLDTCYYISAKFLRGNRSFNTVKAWALTARRYSPVVRALYHADEIPFSHFVYAAQRKFDVDSTQTGEKVWQDILNHSYDQMTALGREISVRELENHFEPHAQVNSGSSYKTGIQSPTTNEYTFTPIVLADLDDQPVLDNPEIELEEELHKLAGIVSRISTKFPMYAGLVNQGLALITNALRQILSPVVEEA
jgi:hypothetical protein